MLFGNTAGMTARLATLFGAGRVIPGFPGVVGGCEGDAVTYTISKQQPTVMGALSGGPAGPLGAVAEALRSAGFPTDVERDVEGWLASRAALVVPWRRRSRRPEAPRPPWRATKTCSGLGCEPPARSTGPSAGRVAW